MMSLRNESLSVPKDFLTMLPTFEVASLLLPSLLTESAKVKVLVKTVFNLNPDKA